MMSTLVVLAFIGTGIGWIYKIFVGDAGPSTATCIIFGVIGSMAGGLIFIFADLGGELVSGLLSSILVLVAADVLSREAGHDE